MQDNANIFNEAGYRKNINAIRAVLTGRKKTLLRGLKRQMQDAVGRQDFERAAGLRDQWQGIEDVLNHRMHLQEKGKKYHGRLQQRWRSTEKNIIMILGGAVASISRVEGYDISHISGKQATGSMVVFKEGIPARAEYRMFKIKTVPQSNDVAMLKEVIARRIPHVEWPFPDLMVLDGGKPQLNGVVSLLKKAHSPLWRRVVALAKREEELYHPSHKNPLRLDSLPLPTAFFFQYIRDESHRFAKKYHHKLREFYYRDASAKNKISTAGFPKKTP